MKRAAVIVQFCVLVFACFTASLKHAHAEARTCGSLFSSAPDSGASKDKISISGIFRGLKPWNDGSRFDKDNLDAIERIKADYLKLLRQGTPAERLPPAESPEAKLARFEAIADHNNYNLFSFNTWRRNADKSELRLVERKLKKIRGRSAAGVSQRTQAEDLLILLYLLSRSDPTSRRYVLDHSISDALAELVRMRIEVSLIRKGLLPTLQEIGLLADPSKAEKIKRFLRRFRTFTTLGSAITLEVLSWTLPVSSKDDLSILMYASKDTPQVILRKIIATVQRDPSSMTIGMAIDEMRYDALLAHGTAAKAQFYLSWTQRIAGRALVAWIIYELLADEILPRFGINDGANPLPNRFTAQDRTALIEEQFQLWLDLQIAVYDFATGDEEFDRESKRIIEQIPHSEEARALRRKLESLSDEQLWAVAQGTRLLSEFTEE